MLLSVLCAVTAGAGAGRKAVAQDTFPSRSVTVVVPFPPGGGTDVLARVLAQKLSEFWRQPVVVENRPGAAGKLGTEQVQRAPADGHTLVMASTGALMALAGPPGNRPFAVEEVLSPVTLAAAPAYLVFAHPSLGIGSIAELLAEARRRPDEIAFGSSGVGSASHLCGELFAAMADIKLLHIPYRGTGQAQQDLLSGRIGLMFSPPQTVASAVANGGLRALAVTSEERDPLMPDMPTVSESGVPGYSAVGWFGLFAPKGTPVAIVERIHADAERAFALPGVRGKLANLGAVPRPMRPEAFTRFVNADIAKWQRLIRDRGITME